MSQQSSNYLPQGEGPHPTMAGNMLDPSISADGAKGGRGVGGTSESTIKDEGLEHMKGGNGQTSSGLGQGSSNSGSVLGGSAMNYDHSSGLGQTTGQGQNVSSSAQHQDGIDHIRSQAGLDSQAGRGTGLDSNTGVSSGVSSTDKGVAGQDPRNTTSGSTGYSGNNTTSGSTGYSGNNNTSGSTGYSGDNAPSSRSGLTGSDAATRNTHTAGDIHGPGSQAREGTAAGGHDIDDSKTSEDTANAPIGSAGSNAKGGHIAGPNDDANLSAPPESIPTAGGERIGAKHWGESKVIPDNPPRSEADKAKDAASDVTKKNTDKNAQSGSTSSDSTQKESMVDKIKDKLHMGHK